jgi:hypothetical protein
MRHVPIRAFLLTLLAASAAFAADPASGLTIVLEFQGPHSDRSIVEMEQEAQADLKDSGLSLNWALRGDLNHSSPSDLVLVRFKGRCVLDTGRYSEDDGGPLAFTYVTDGVVLPFSEVACDRVTASVRSAMWGGDYENADTLLGRALGRVLVHELVHILAGDGIHGHTGIAKRALSGSELICPTLELSPEDAERISAELKNR